MIGDRLLPVIAAPVLGANVDPDQAVVECPFERRLVAHGLCEGIFPVPHMSLGRINLASASAAGGRPRVHADLREMSAPSATPMPGSSIRLSSPFRVLAAVAICGSECLEGRSIARYAPRSVGFPDPLVALATGDIGVRLMALKVPVPRAIQTVRLVRGACCAALDARKVGRAFGAFSFVESVARLAIRLAFDTGLRSTSRARPVSVLCLVLAFEDAAAWQTVGSGVAGRRDMLRGNFAPRTQPQ